jgi:hypothetical protein
MKKLLLLLIFISVSIFAQEYKRYHFKSGKIVYESTGAMTGTSTTYFDNYGMLEAKKSNLTIDMMGVKQEHNSLEIMKDRWVYSVNLKTNTATKIENPMYQLFPNGVEGEEVAIAMMKKMGGKKIGTETVSGKNCDIWDVPKMMSKIWVWKTIPIKTETNVMGMQITQTATSVETDIPISQDKFNIPKGITIKTMDKVDYNKMLGK